MVEEEEEKDEVGEGGGGELDGETLQNHQQQYCLPTSSSILERIGQE